MEGRICSKLVEESMVPDLSHLLEVSNEPLLNWVIRLILVPVLGD